ncbi:MAG: DnaJ domain-containing protein [Victivallaceae bacterium]|nr:DnaJ domain-containing protein [Victivallaceae bacterium]
MLYPFEVLELQENASLKEIRKAYLRKLRVYSPEKAPEMFQAVSEAYEMLKDEESRARLELFGMPLNGNEAPEINDLLPLKKFKIKRSGVATWQKIIKQSKSYE